MGNKSIDFVSGARGEGGGQGELIKATITPLGNYLGKDPAKQGGIGEGDAITVLFNPKEFTLEKSVTWNFHGTAGQDASLMEFGGSDGETLSFKLFADTSRQGLDVRAFTEQIRALTYPDEKLGHPRVVRFDWGEFSFKGFIVKLTQVFTHHLRDGTPVRATLDLTIKELDLTPRDPNGPDDDDDTETGTESRMRGRGGGGTENGTEGGRDVDANSTSGGNESMGEPDAESDNDTEAGENTESDTEGGGENKDGPWVKVAHVFPAGGQVDGTIHWPCYHHSAVYIQVHVFGVKTVKITVNAYGGSGLSMYITGFWKQASAGSAAPKDGKFDIGGVGQTSPTEPAHESSHKCHFINTFGTQFGPKGHPAVHLVNIGMQTINGNSTTQNLSHDKYVVAFQPRQNGTFVIEAQGIGPYDVPLKGGQTDPKDNVQVTIVNWKVGD